MLNVIERYNHVVWYKPRVSLVQFPYLVKLLVSESEQIVVRGERRGLRGVVGVVGELSSEAFLGISCVKEHGMWANPRPRDARCPRLCLSLFVSIS